MAVTGDTEPIDLHSLSVLLNYERAIAEPRFRFAKILDCYNPSTGRLQGGPERPDMWPPANSVGANRIKRGWSLGFMPPLITGERSKTPDLPSNIKRPGLTSSQALMVISAKELETIYWQIRSHHGGVTCLHILNHFLNFFSPGRPLQIRLGNGSSFTTNAGERTAIEYELYNAKMCTSFETINNLSPNEDIDRRGYFIGLEDTEEHIVCGFKLPKQSGVAVVLDLASMQLGDAGRGSCGELFRLSSRDDYEASFKNTHARVRKIREFDWTAPADMASNEGWINYTKTVATRVKERWDSRVDRPWCAQCGAPKPKSKCPCGKVFYCDENHQKTNWRYHKKWHN